MKKLLASLLLVLAAMFFSYQPVTVFAQETMDFTLEESDAAAAAAIPAADDQTRTESAEEVPTFRPPSDFGYTSPVRNVSVAGFIGRIIQFALGIVGALLLATLIYGGGTWMLAGDDAKKVQSAKTTLKNAVIGMMIVALSYTIVTTIFTVGNQVLQGAPATTDAEEVTP